MRVPPQYILFAVLFGTLTSSCEDDPVSPDCSIDVSVPNLVVTLIDDATGEPIPRGFTGTAMNGDTTIAGERLDDALLGFVLPEGDWTFEVVASPSLTFEHPSVAISGLICTPDDAIEIEARMTVATPLEGI